MIRHNLKTALRNLWKYRAQTLISIVSLAVGLVAVATVHTFLQNFSPPPICHEPYYDQLYTMDCNMGSSSLKTDADHIRLHHLLTDNGGTRCAETVNWMELGQSNQTIAFHKTDSTTRQAQIFFNHVLPAAMNLMGERSAITGEKIPVLKCGEAVISDMEARRIFGKDNPVGATFTLKIGREEQQEFVIRDVFKKQNMLMNRGNDMLCVCSKTIMEYDESFFATVYIGGYQFLLREGGTRQQAEQELTQLLKPLDFEPKLVPYREMVEEELQSILPLRLSLYLIAGLILLAAVIGFLRMQVQLYWMRRRELLLRMTHGATWERLYGMLMTESVIVVTAVFLLSLYLAKRLAGFLQEVFLPFRDDLPAQFDVSLCKLLVLSALLLALCAVVVGITLRRICRSEQSFAAGMQRSHNHLFRNVMIGVQLTICLVFVCGTLGFSQIVQALQRKYGIPEDNEYWRSCLMITNENKLLSDEAFVHQVSQLGDVGQCIQYDMDYQRLEDTGEMAKFEELFGRDRWLRTYMLSDTALLSFHHIPIQWKNGHAESDRYVLLSDWLYEDMKRAGLGEQGTIRFWEEDDVYPIAGTVGDMPYMFTGTRAFPLYVIQKDAQDISEMIVVPKKGAYKKAKREVEELIQKLHPEFVDQNVVNLHENLSKDVNLFQNMMVGARILCIVCLIISAMSIYSSISLDTRTRRKEMAIRKVNGAQKSDIALLFGRLYIVLLAVGTLVAVPVAILFNRLCANWFIVHVDPPVLSILCGCLFTYLLVLCIVGWHILHIARVNPVEYITKE